MGNITKKEREARIAQAEAYKALCGGYVPWRLYYEGGEVFMWVIDEEIDPIRVRFVDGAAFIEAGQYSYAAFMPGALKEIAEAVKYADAMWEEIIESGELDEEIGS